MIRAEEINSVDSEAAVIASLIKRPEWIFYSEQLLPEHFTDVTNKIVYVAISNLSKQGVHTIDALNIVESLNSKEATKPFVNEVSVATLKEMIEYSSILARDSVEAYKMAVSNVRNTAFRRDVYKRLNECIGLCVTGEVDDLESKIYKLIDDVMVSYSHLDEVPEFGDVVDALWEEVEAHQCNQGTPFIFPSLNEYARIEEGELVVLAAPAKCGKSMFALNEAVDLMAHGKSVMYIDSELSSRLFLCRLLSRLTGIEFIRIRDGRYSSEERETIRKAREWVKKKKFVHIYMPIFDKQAVYTAVKKVAHRFEGLDVLIVDYLKASGKNTEAYAVYSELGGFTDMLKNDICGRMRIAGIAMAQLNESQRLADSAKIERNASTIIKMTPKTRDEIEQEGRDGGNRKLFVAKNRNGAQHVDGEWINVCFDGGACLMSEAPKKHALETPY